MKPIVVLGSLNMDLICTAPRIPRPGETIIGRSFLTKEGGKGANQATAIAKLGMPTHMIGCVGEDAFGDSLLASLRTNGAQTDSVLRLRGVSTGTAHITVDDSGENNIVVIPGANGCVSARQAREAAQLIAAAAFALTQLEVPLDAVAEFLRIARGQRVPTVLNPAPLPPDGLADELLGQIDLITPNETEIEMLTGICVTDAESFSRAARWLHKKGVRQVICTMGAKGALYSDSDLIVEQPAFPVRAVDTTCAGDSFTGAFVVRRAEGASVADAMRFAAKVGALTVMKMGAQESLPTRAQADAEW